MERSWMLLLTVCGLLLQGLATAGECPSLLDSIRGEFQQLNANIESIEILDTKPKHPEYWVIARGIVEDLEFRGSFEDELFGVFVVDSDFENVVTMIDAIPTPRWNDYVFWITEHDAENVTVLGHGSTYGDGPLEKRYRVPTQAQDRMH